MKKSGRNPYFSLSFLFLLSLSLVYLVSFPSLPYPEDQIKDVKSLKKDLKSRSLLLPNGFLASIAPRVSTPPSPPTALAPWCVHALAPHPTCAQRKPTLLHTKEARPGFARRGQVGLLAVAPGHAPSPAGARPRPSTAVQHCAAATSAPPQRSHLPTPPSPLCPCPPRAPCTGGPAATPRRFDSTRSAPMEHRRRRSAPAGTHPNGNASCSIRADAIGGGSQTRTRTRTSHGERCRGIYGLSSYRNLGYRTLIPSQLSLPLKFCGGDLMRLPLVRIGIWSSEKHHLVDRTDT